jgi:4-amino-4-deoxy-L-arabinose transferase-like glycosyltransferase
MSRRPAWSFRRRLLLITAAALVVRIVVFALDAHDLPLSDGLWYHGEAQIIAGGHGYLAPGEYLYQGHAHPTAEHPPLFPALLALVTWTFHQSIPLHQLACALMGTAGVFAVGLLGRRVGGEPVGLFAAVLAALAPNVWQYETLLLAESLLLLTVSLFLLAVYRFRDRPDPWRAVQLGVTLALCAYARSELALLGLVIVVPLMVRTPGLGGAWERLKVLAIAAGMTVALMAPWSIRTLTAADTPVLFSNNLDSVIAGANCRYTYDGAAVGSWLPLCHVSQIRAGGGQIDAFARARTEGLHYMSAHLDQLPRVMVFRVGRVLEVYKPFVGLGRDGRSVPLSVSTTVAFYLLAIFGAAGAVRLHRQRRIVWPLIVLVPYVTVLAMLG